MDKLIDRSISWNEEKQIYQSFQSNSGQKVTTGVELLIDYSASNTFDLEMAFNWQNTKNQNLKNIKVGYSPNILAYLKASFQVNEDVVIGSKINYVGEMEAMWDTSPVDTENLNSPQKGRIGNKVDDYFNVSANIRVNDFLIDKMYVNLNATNFFDTEIRYPTTTYSEWAPNGTIGNRFNVLFTIGYKIGN